MPKTQQLGELIRDRIAERRTGDIENGVRGQKTVSMQVRVLKEQNAMLKAAAFVEGRPATAILRDLLDMYFEAKTNDPDPNERERFLTAVALNASEAEPKRATLRATGD
jgi:hypothetical protein